jgi:hypothetical protein
MNLRAKKFVISRLKIRGIPANWEQVTHAGVATRMRHVAALALILGLALSGCSYVSVNADGSVRMVGLFSVTLPPKDLEFAETSGESPTATVAAATFGMAWFTTPIGSSFSIGYSRESFTAVGLGGGDLETEKITSILTQPQFASMPCTTQGAQDECEVRRTIVE